MFKSTINIETDEQEAARLAEAPERSKAHFWSTLPVTITGDARGLVLTLPSDQGHKITVVPYLFEKARTRRLYVGETREESDEPRLHNGSWRCLVVASTHSHYSPGGHDMVISESEIRRSTLATIIV